MDRTPGEFFPIKGQEVAFFRYEDLGINSYSACDRCAFVAQDDECRLFPCGLGLYLTKQAYLTFRLTGELDENTDQKLG